MTTRMQRLILCMTTCGPTDRLVRIRRTHTPDYEWSRMLGCKCATVGLMCPTPNGQIDRLGCMTTSVQPMGLVCMDLGSWQQVNMCAWLQPRTCVNKFSYVASKSSMVKSKLPYLHDDKRDTHESLA